MIKTLFLWIIAKNERKKPECIRITLRVKQKLEFLSKVGARIALIKNLNDGFELIGNNFRINALKGNL